MKKRFFILPALLLLIVACGEEGEVIPGSAGVFEETKEKDSPPPESLLVGIDVLLGKSIKMRTGDAIHFVIDGKSYYLKLDHTATHQDGYIVAWIIPRFPDVSYLVAEPWWGNSRYVRKGVYYFSSGGWPIFPVRTWADELRASTPAFVIREISGADTSTKSDDELEIFIFSAGEDIPNQL